MASTIAAEITTAPHLLSTPNTSTPQVTQKPTSKAPSKSHDVLATFNYYKDPGDGSPPAPSYVGKPETYERPAEALQHVVHDIRGEEDKYTLDTTGFQIWKHASEEKDFVDDATIKRNYYPEVETILKEAYVLAIHPFRD